MRTSNKCACLYTMKKLTYLCGAEENKQTNCNHFIQSTKKDVDVGVCKFRSPVRKMGIRKCRCEDAQDELESVYQ